MTTPQASAIHPGEPSKRQKTTFEKARTVFLAGVLVIVPLVIAVYSVIFLMGITEWIFGDFIDVTLRVILQIDPDITPRWMPIAKALTSFVMALSVIMLVGWLSTFLLIRRFIHLGEAVITRVPLVKFFYSVPKEVLNTFAMQQKASFKRVVMFEYPRLGIWAIGFATGEVRLTPAGTKLVAVFAPTTPNPTSGFLLYLHPDEVYDTNMPLEEGARLIISGGILSPESIQVQPFCGLDKEPIVVPFVPLPSPIEPEPDPSKESSS